MSRKTPPRITPGIVGLAIAFIATRAPANTYFVSQHNPAAADANPGTEGAPWKTLGRSATAAGAGDAVRVGTGVYREQLKLDRSGADGKPVMFEAAPGAEVVLTGADRVTGWKHEGADLSAVYSADWPHSFINFSPHHTHPDDESHRLIGRAEQVFVRGYPLRQVLEKGELARGTFFADLDAKRLFARAADDRDLSKSETLVEASTRETVLECSGDFVTVRGLRVRYAANRAQQGAAVFRGAHDVVEDCVFERTNASGAAFLAPDQVVRRCRFTENGQLGFGANGAHRLLLTECEIRGNNVKGFDRGWEAGGDKLVLCRGAALDHCTFADNRGNGVWFDIGNEECEVRNCLIDGNEDAGIFYEISFGLHAHDNVIVGNGLADTPGAWGAAAGICLSSSPSCVVERNLFVGNKEGFNFREQARTTPRIVPSRDDQRDTHPASDEPVWNHDEVVRNNVLAYNRDAQVWGWFDVADQRHWPRAMWQEQTDERHPAKPPAGPAPGTDLAALHLEFAGNWYAVAPGQGLFNWGTNWRRHMEYGSLDGARRELGVEDGGRLVSLDFSNTRARDYRLPPDSPLLKADAYPHGTVPGVTLGAEPGTR